MNKNRQGLEGDLGVLLHMIQVERVLLLAEVDLL